MEPERDNPFNVTSETACTVGVNCSDNYVDYLPLSDEYSVDTCTYTSGNWVVDCSDNCLITSEVDVGGNDIYITGTGTFRTTANIINCFIKIGQC